VTEQTADAAAEPVPVLDESPPRSKTALGTREAGAPVLAPADGAAALAPAAPAPGSPAPSGGLLPNLFAGLGAFLVVVLFLVIYVSRRAAKERL